MPLSAFMKISNAKGESKVNAVNANYVDWVEIQGWEWEVTAETSWTKGGGASVGKPAPGALSFEHYYDRASPTILAYICAGKSFDTIELHMCKTTGAASGLQPYFKMKMKDAFLTKVNNSANEEGNVVQKIELVFKEVVIEYRPQGMGPGGGNSLGEGIEYKWNIPGGSTSGHGS